MAHCVRSLRYPPWSGAREGSLVRRTPFVLAVVAAALVGVAPAADAAGEAVPVQVLAINDLHGRISLTEGDESRLVVGPGPDGTFGKDAAGRSDDDVTRVGGVMNVATTVQELQRDFRSQAGGSAASIFVGGGDLIGASPPVSGAYRDEPTIEALNELGLDVSAVGDDEFGLGTAELRRISAATDGQNTDDVTACQGVTPGADGCFGTDEHAFTGAEFPYLAANVVSRQTGEPMLPPYQVFFTPLGVKVALIGVVTDKPRHVPPEGITDVQFLDPADAVDRWVPELQDQGVQAIGALVHEGGPETGPGAADPNSCDQLDGPIVDINNRIDPAVDFIVSGHTHGAYTCMLPVPRAEPRLVTQAGSHGELITDIRLTLDRGTGDIDRAATYSAVNVPVERREADARLQAIVDYWTAGPGSQAGAEPAGAVDTSATADAPAGANRAALGIVVLISIALLVVATLAVHRRLQAR